MFGKKKIPMQATIVADEGYKYVSNGTHSSKQHEKYMVEVHPEGEEPFRTEVKAWVSWPDMPRVGDVVPILYKPGTHAVELHLDGDPRFDAKLIADRQKQADAARREELLNEPLVGTPAAGTTPTAQAPTGFCSSCGHPHTASETFCSSCGHRLA